MTLPTPCAASHWQRHHKLIFIALAVFSGFLCLKNMWVAEDAFITLRTVEQFLHGNGFRWNPHDRTQVYTSPLWFLCIIATTVFSKTLYLDLVVLSVLLHIALLGIMARCLPSCRHWVATVLLLSLSQAFFEFTGSGLEYPLAYCLLAISVLLYVRHRPTEDCYWIALSSGLALITRHDLLFLLAPLLCHLAWVYSRLFHWRKLLGLALLLGGPLLLWSLFSLLYYGVPFPNTAYAKLGIPGLSLPARLHRGLIYLGVSAKVDPITPAILFLGTVKALAARQIRLLMVALGTLLALLYVTVIGGDYMVGRFYAPIYLVATLALVLSPWTKPYLNRPTAALMAAACFWLIILFVLAHLDQIRTGLEFLGGTLDSPRPALITAGLFCTCLAALACLRPLGYRYGVGLLFSALLFHSALQNDSPWTSGGPDWGKTNEYEIYVAIDTTSRERYWIYRWTSLFGWLKRDPDNIFPAGHTWCERGFSVEPVSILPNVGMPAYCMPLNYIGFDYNGLVDPVMARMPKHPQVPWLPGGSIRIIPDGYMESLQTQQNRIKDPDMARYYDKIRLITQSNNLFDPERLKAIIAFNLGAYEPWRRAYIDRVLQHPPPPPDGF